MVALLLEWQFATRAFPRADMTIGARQRTRTQYVIVEVGPAMCTPSRSTCHTRLSRDSARQRVGVRLGRHNPDGCAGCDGEYEAHRSFAALIPGLSSRKKRPPARAWRARNVTVFSLASHAKCSR